MELTIWLVHTYSRGNSMPAERNWQVCPAVLWNRVYLSASFDSTTERRARYENNSLDVSMTSKSHRIVPANVCELLASTLESRQSWSAAWQLFPVVVPILQTPFRVFEKPASKLLRKNPNLIARLICSLSASSTRRLLWIWDWITSVPAFLLLKTHSIAIILLPRLYRHAEAVDSFSEAIARLLYYDEILSTASGFFFRELKQSGAEYLTMEIDLCFGGVCRRSWSWYRIYAWLWMERGDPCLDLYEIIGMSYADCKMPHLAANLSRHGKVCS